MNPHSQFVVKTSFNEALILQETFKKMMIRKKKKKEDMNNTDEQNIFSMNMVYKCMPQSEFWNVFRINTSD